MSTTWPHMDGSEQDETGFIATPPPIPRGRDIWRYGVRNAPQGMTDEQATQWAIADLAEMGFGDAADMTASYAKWAARYAT